MGEGKVSAFGGVMGRVLGDSMSLGTVATGFALGLVILTASFILGLAGADALAALFGQIVIALALARFALNGMSGESSGTIFSTAGGSWPMAMAVAGRYLALNLLWMVPILLIGWGAASAAIQPPAPGAPLVLPVLAVLTSKPLLLAAGFLLFGMASLPPAFLIVAVRSEQFTDIFSPAVWRAAFSGRLGDLYAIYVVHAGGLGMLIVLALPAILLGFAAGTGIGTLFVGAAMAFAGGLAVTLLGRLCGFYAFGDEQGSPAGRMHPGHRGAPATEIYGGPAPASAAAADRDGAAEPPVVADGAPGESIAHPSGKPALPDPAARVAGARRRFETDRDGTVRELQELRDQFAPSPHVLHALTLSLHQAGRAPEAILVAREALPLCLEQGHVALAADLFSALWKQAKELGLSHEQVVAIAAALARAGHAGLAITAYGIALRMDPGDRKAIKGLLQLADQRMHRDGRPGDAARIYTFLLTHAAGSTLADDMRRGLAEAEARARRAS